MGEKPLLRAVPSDGVDSRPPLRRTKGSRPVPCRHRHVEVDPRERRVVCLDCKTEVDPYVALDMLAQEIEQYDWARDSARAEAARTKQELANLKRLEGNAKARVRNAIRELPECLCEPPRRYGWFYSECGGRVVRR